MFDFQLRSAAFESGAPIPRDYTREGANVSPPLSWQCLPDGTQSLALLCTDPDAPTGTWTHWVIFNIPAHWPGLPENFPKTRRFQQVLQGMTSYYTLGYDGPFPPRGQTHRYFFRLYALARLLKLAPGIPAQQLERHLAPVLLAQTELMGTYTR